VSRLLQFVLDVGDDLAVKQVNGEAIYTKNPPQTTLRGIFVEHRRYENLVKPATEDCGNHYFNALYCG
jgi:hypothetical protein